MADVDFTRSDVEEKTSDNPWGLREDFFDEVNTEDMWETAQSYAVAAEEGAEVEDLSARASEAEHDAGTYGGEPLADAEGRLEETAGNVQSLQIGEVVGALGRVIASAGEAQENVQSEIDDLDEEVNQHRSDAYDEALAWREQLFTAVAETNSRSNPRESSNTPQIAPPDGTVLDHSRVSAEEAGENYWKVPDWLHEEIREAYIEKAVTDAEDAHGKIGTHIEDYRSIATREAGELAGSGYDLGGSGFDIWYTEGMSEYHAQEIDNALKDLAENPVDGEALRIIDQISMFSKSATEGLLDEDGKSRLTSAEHNYIYGLYEHLTDDNLADLGGDHGLTGPTKGHLMDALNAVMNPLFNSTGRTPEVPDSVAHYLDNYSENFHDDPRKVYQNQNILARFDNFADLMGHAEIPPGHEFGTMQFQSAMDIQNYIDSHHERTSREGAILQSPGISGLLSSVSLNNDLSLYLMADEGNLNDLMEAEWSDSTGAGEVLVSAITPTRSDDLNSDQKEIADTFLKHFSEHPERLSRDWDEDSDEAKDSHVPFDPSGFYGAMADATMLRSDAIMHTDPNEQGWSSTERDDLFTTLATADDANYEYFKNRVFDHQSAVYEAIYDDGVTLGDGERREEQVVQSYEEQVQMFTDALNLGEGEVIKHYGEASDAAAAAKEKFNRAALSAAVIGASTVPTFGASLAGSATAATAWGVAAGVGGEAIAGNTLMQGSFDDYQPSTPHELDKHEWEEGYLNKEMAYYSIVDGVSRAEGVEGPDFEQVTEHFDDLGTQPDHYISDHIAGELGMSVDEINRDRAHGAPYVRDNPEISDPNADD